jgi:cysteine desulfurase / selenocysteine lyase
MRIGTLGLPWRDGDEVLVIEGDYPATILPWQRLADQGVRPAGGLLSAEELAAATGPRTRVLA